MYTPPAFAIDDRSAIFDMIRASRLANFITATSEGIQATPLPMFLDETQGEMGVFYAHMSRANPQWKMPVNGDALAVFMGADAYITPSWYASKAEHGKVVPTWNYQTVHAKGQVEFFDDPYRLCQVVERITALHEFGRTTPWKVEDAPEAFIQAQLKGIVGLKLTITSLEGKSKMSQNRNDADRQGVKSGLSSSDREHERIASVLIPD